MRHTEPLPFVPVTMRKPSSGRPNAERSLRRFEREPVDVAGAIPTELISWSTRSRSQCCVGDVGRVTRATDQIHAVAPRRQEAARRCRVVRATSVRGTSVGSTFSSTTSASITHRPMSSRLGRSYITPSRTSSRLRQIPVKKSILSF